MKILVTGVNGQLGHDVQKRLALLNADCAGASRLDFDLADTDGTVRFIEALRPGAVIHCAAYTAVDKAEDERELCYAVNVEGTAAVARACAAVGAKMIYISTDYVFDGLGESPYEIDAPRNPSSYYGWTKSLGEDLVRQWVARHFILRVSWAFGSHGGNFVKTMSRLGQEREELQVVHDQIGSPTYTYDLALLLSEMVQTERYGTYHATNEGFCSWYEFAREIMRLAKLKAAVKPIRTEEYPTKAIRPRNSRLSKRSLDEAGFSRLPSWQDALERYILTVQRDTPIP
jgi:dTDP-4-dehydrorhamnose reductase